ncbi:TetR/AcrR family transcriptional regulator [Natrononativus amylolyticus]|uniref:TetR/AcrR family transcriptional regulator n=1 Tax=Natrononativus amylolyticus TaxID=2963434 RepID=UPI0020CE8A97|nr:TetR/AcrR family transcriptional regulator [Natrononativus amylolyticus]
MTDTSAREAIMTATYEALCEHGYTDLTAQNIADRTDKSKSLLFYHYDSKEDLVADFIEYLLERFDERVEESRDLPPIERLATFVDWFLYSPDDAERTSFHTALLELRTQAPYNERYREQLRKSDDRLRETLEEILEAGIEAGDFRDHDTTEMAALLIAAFDGARIRQLTIGRDAYLEQVRSAATAEIIDDLLVGETTLPVDLTSAGGSGGGANDGGNDRRDDDELADGDERESSAAEGAGGDAAE